MSVATLALGAYGANNLSAAEEPAAYCYAAIREAAGFPTLHCHECGQTFPCWRLGLLAECHYREPSQGTLPLGNGHQRGGTGNESADGGKGGRTGNGTD